MVKQLSFQAKILFHNRSRYFFDTCLYNMYINLRLSCNPLTRYQREKKQYNEEIMRFELIVRNVYFTYSYNTESETKSK